MAHELWLIKEATMTNITPLTGSISWRSNIGELGDELSFTIAFNDTEFFPKNPCDIGDIIMLKNGEVILRQEKRHRFSTALSLGCLAPKV